MHQHAATTNRRNTILKVVCGVALLVLVATYVSRAWIRTTGVTWYAKTFILPSVNDQFNSDIAYVNEQLAQLQITVDQPMYPNGCSKPLYEGFGVSTSCTRAATSGEVYDTEQFVQTWPQKSQLFEDRLFANGWQQINDTNQDIATLLDTSKYQPEIVYALDNGKVRCAVRIGFNKYDENNRRVFVDEHCSRPLDLFGGY